MLIERFKEIRNKIYEDIHAASETDIRFMRDALGLQDMAYGRIKTYSAEDSKVLALFTLKYNVAVLLEFISRNGVELGSDICMALCNALFEEIPQASPECSLEIEDIKARTDEVIVDILCSIGEGMHVEKIKSYLSLQEIPDGVSVNLAVVFTAPSWKSYDLRVINELVLGPVLVELLRSFKESLRPQIKERILDSCKKRLRNERDRSIIYQIFYELNTGKDIKMFEIEEDEKEEAYVGFIYSLMVDEESCLKGYEVLSKAGLFNDLRKALEMINVLSQAEYKRIRPEDEKLIYHLMQVIERLVSSDWHGLGFVRLYFMRFVELFLNTLVGQISLRIKGQIYEILSSFMRDGDCKETICEFMRGVGIFNKEAIHADFEKELESKNFSMAPSFLRFCTFLGNEECIRFAMYALKSEDPSTVTRCFDVIERFVDKKNTEGGSSSEFIVSQLSLMSQHIRVAMLNNSQVTNRILEFQLSTGIVIGDVSIINVIINTPNPRFFEYVRLFEDFSFFMNENFLERLSEDEEEGFKYLCEVTANNHEACKFVMNNEDWFNAYVKNNPCVQEAAIRIYENLVDYDIENVEVSFDRGFILPDIPHRSVFSILSKLILYSVYTRKTSYSRYITDKDYSLDSSNINEYCLYIKCRIVVGDNVEDRIKYLMKQYTGIEDLLGYYEVSTGISLNISSSKNLLVNIGKKDTSMFINMFSNASNFEKFLLFFFIGEIDAEEGKAIEKIVKEEITRIMVSQSSSTSEKMILRQCLITLLSLNNIDSIVRLIGEYDDTDLLLKANIRNLLCGGSYFNSSLVMKGPLELQVYAVLLLYYKSVWDLAALKDWILYLRRECKDNDDLEYLISDIKSKNIRIELE
ncbi:uncharacterized protein Eint_061060 [Encephalitozoon intestinalis ATCC 50506]|uniref:Uncharacterized protein n=1 Tax=Encephalitozoon intestinalis (strain ATCC 50506) TaxID=876142 RepID=E0S7N4_ENCIT|nr:uncharacterized protein Eint_061060 [Encephalitozoon intestinalis ATCC 50506]ADM11713.1 hypothetical protein Eint_061060 [Encephalitozoon intestinalis ATCC 50506]UTX45450.1 transportin [Encephalitozoon intestinalis]